MFGISTKVSRAIFTYLQKSSGMVTLDDVAEIIDAHRQVKIPSSKTVSGQLNSDQLMNKFACYLICMSVPQQEEWEKQLEEAYE